MPSPDDRMDNQWAEDPAGRIRREAIAWLSRLNDREATAEDRLAFESWRSQSAAHERTFDKIARVWGDQTLDAAARYVARTECSGKNFFFSVKTQTWRQVFTAAACLVLVVFGARYFDLATRLQADYHTAVGEQRTIQLSDRSVVTLNTNTAIATDFDVNGRHIRILKGEAFFQVRHDPERPFLVHGGETATRAIGTAFVVRHQPDHDRITVIEGVVEVTTFEEDQVSEPVTAGRMVETRKGRLQPVQKVDSAKSSAWLQGLLIVEDVPLAHVIDEVGRYHPGTILLWNKSIGNMRATGTYKLENPSKILYHLSKTFPLQSVTIADRLVILF